MPHERILGALIGLANAAMDHEDHLTPDIHQLVLAALRSTASEEHAVHALIARLHDAKFSLVPDCKICTHPCGRHSDYDMKLLQFESPAAQMLKKQLIDCLCRISRQQEQTNEEYVRLYQGLRAISEYRRDESLQTFVIDLEKAI